MLQEIRSGNGDDDGPATLRFYNGCVAATVTTRRPCDYGVEPLLGCTIARRRPSDYASGGVLHDCSICAAALAIQQRAMTNTKQLKTLNFPKGPSEKERPGPAPAAAPPPPGRPRLRPRPRPGPAPASATALPRPGPSSAPAPAAGPLRPRPRRLAAPAAPALSEPRRDTGDDDDDDGVWSSALLSVRSSPLVALVRARVRVHAIPQRTRRPSRKTRPNDSAGGLPTAQSIAPKYGAGVFAPAP